MISEEWKMKNKKWKMKSKASEYLELSMWVKRDSSIVNQKHKTFLDFRFLKS